MRAKRFGEFIGEATAPAVTKALERLQAGNLEFISGLIKEYERDVPYSSRCSSVLSTVSSVTSPMGLT